MKMYNKLNSILECTEQSMNDTSQTHPEKIIKICIVCRSLYETINLPNDVINYLKSNNNINIQFYCKSHCDFNIRFSYKGSYFSIDIKRHDTFVSQRGSLYEFIFIPEDIDNYNQHCKENALYKLRHAYDNNVERLIIY